MLRHVNRTRLPVKPITIQTSSDEDDEDDQVKNSSPAPSENNSPHNSTNNHQESSGDLQSSADVEQNSTADANSSNDYPVEVAPELNSIEDILRADDLEVDDSLAPIVENSSTKSLLELPVMTPESIIKLASESENSVSDDSDEEETSRKPTRKMQKIEKSAETSKKFTKSKNLSKQTKKETIDDDSDDEVEHVEKKDAPPKRLTRGSHKKNEPKNEKHSNQARPTRSTRNSKSTDNETNTKIEKIAPKVANKNEPKPSLQTKSSTRKRDSLSNNTPNKTPQIPRKDDSQEESILNGRRGVKRRLVLENTDDKNQVKQRESRRRKIDDKTSSTEDEESDEDQKKKISKKNQPNETAITNKKFQKPIIPAKAKSKVPSKTENKEDLISVSSSNNEETPKFVEVKASSSIKAGILQKQAVVEQPRPKNQITTNEAIKQAAQRSNPRVHLENFNPALISKTLSIVELKRQYLAKQIELASKQMVSVDHDVYLKKLQAMQLEKELNIEPSAYTKDLIKQE